MKNLLLIRHAKSSWKDLRLDDHDRPLNGRGKRDAPIMGMRLKERDITPQLMLSSSAKRARATAKKIAKQIGYPKQHIATTPDLYHAGSNEILEVIHRLDDENDQVAIFGHNPGFTSCANLLANLSIDNVPTCGIVSIRFDADSWASVQPGTGTLLFYDYPKKALS